MTGRSTSRIRAARSTRWGRRGKRLEVLIPPGTFRSPQTPVAVGGDDRLFVPDYSRGISVVDLKTRSATLVPHPPESSLTGGIDEALSERADVDRGAERDETGADHRDDDGCGVDADRSVEDA